jgi:hypothetical protein
MLASDCGFSAKTRSKLSRWTARRVRAWLGLRNSFEQTPSLHVFGSADGVNSWFTRQGIVPAKNLQPVRPAILRNQEPAVCAQPWFQTNCATPIPLHFITSIKVLRASSAPCSSTGSQLNIFTVFLPRPSGKGTVITPRPWSKVKVTKGEQASVLNPPGWDGFPTCNGGRAAPPNTRSRL